MSQGGLEIPGSPVHITGPREQKALALLSVQCSEPGIVLAVESNVLLNRVLVHCAFSFLCCTNPGQVPLDHCNNYNREYQLLPAWSSFYNAPQSIFLLVLMLKLLLFSQFSMIPALAVHLRTVVLTHTMVPCFPCVRFLTQFWHSTHQWSVLTSTKKGSWWLELSIPCFHSDFPAGTVPYFWP